MNKHLEPVFHVLLPELEKAGIDYWVYGGISIAAYAGKFIRDNQDVDIFVRDVDFENAKSILDGLCNKNGYELKFYPRKDNNDRSKLEIKIDNIEVFSMISTCQSNNIVELKYPVKYGGNEKYSDQILERVKRNISDHRFFTSRDKFIKEMFVNHIKARPDKKKRGKIKIDARAILSLEERSSLGFFVD